MNENTDLINYLAKRPVKWLAEDSADENIVLSSRIRLARNMSDLKFPINSSDSEKEYTRDIIVSAINETSILHEKLNFVIRELPDVDRRFLLERHLVSKEFCRGNAGSVLVMDSDEQFGIMINEEDHARMQIFSAGLALKNLWEIIDEKDTALSEKLSFAFDSNLGYLTSCLSNVGTGMRASVMLNLPGLFMMGHIPGVIQGASKLRMAVRGLYGEGSEPVGYTYQISNQSTLGESEEEIINRLENVVARIVEAEKNARQILFQTRRNFLLNFISRAYGILRYSYIITEKEALNLLSALRMGVDMKLFSSLTIGKINELFMSVQDSHLQKLCEKNLSSPERDAYRAEILRKKMKE